MFLVCSELYTLVTVYCYASKDLLYIGPDALSIAQAFEILPLGFDDVI